MSAPPSIELGTHTVFTQATVRNLKGDDFDLASEFLVKLRTNDCTLILFYGEDSVSQKLCRVWSLTASQIIGPRFAACNLHAENAVAKAFVDLGSDPEHPLRSFALKQIPTIMVYRKGLPQAFYNGDLSSPALGDFALTLACHSDYHEPIQTGASMTVNHVMAMPRPAKYEHFRITSEAYRTEAPIHVRAASFTPTMAPLTGPPRGVPMGAPPPRGLPPGASMSPPRGIGGFPSNSGPGGGGSPSRG